VKDILTPEGGEAAGSDPGARRPIGRGMAAAVSAQDGPETSPVAEVTRLSE
jgi:hypothetical protein